MAKTSSISFDKPPSEMLSQMLFVSYAQRLAQTLSKRIVLFAPTQPEEELAGYDARLIGSGCRELYLQFKRGGQHVSSNEIRFQVDNAPSRKAGTKQLDTLKNDYPPLSAFYVAGGFWDVNCTLEAQKIISSDKDFLDIYAAVSAHAIDLGSKKSSQVCLGSYCRPCNRVTKKYAVHLVRKPDLTHGKDWFYGSELLQKFLLGGAKSGAGCTVRVERGQVIRHPNLKARELFGDNKVFSIPLFKDGLPPSDRSNRRYRESDSTPMLTVRVFDTD